MVGPGFSPRQAQILRLIVLGKSSKQIARELGVAFKTVTSHRATILAKIDLGSIACLGASAIRGKTCS
jgi:DNA-binding NarL/FixJ family response regulator